MLHYRDKRFVREENVLIICAPWCMHISVYAVVYGNTYDTYGYLRVIKCVLYIRKIFL